MNLDWLTEQRIQTISTLSRNNRGTHPSSSFFLPRLEVVGVPRSNHRHQRSPPDARVQVIQHDFMRRRMPDLVNAGAQNQRPVHEQRYPDEKPNGNHPSDLRVPVLPESDIENEEHDNHYAGPE